MKHAGHIVLWASLAFAVCMALVSCKDHDDGTDTSGGNYSGVYCVEAHNAQLTLDHSGSNVTFTLSFTGEISGTGTVDAQTVTLTGTLSETDIFTAVLVFAGDGQSFSGTFQVTDAADRVYMEETMNGVKGACAAYDIDANGIPRFVGADFTQLETIHTISRFRSGFGHSFTDRFEFCRSMKHYYSPQEAYRQNRTVAIYAPVTGIIVAVQDDGHGASIGINNKQILIRPDSHPAFHFRIYHTDLLSAAIVGGKRVTAGELIGYARLFYEDLGERATSFDIAVEVQTPAGVRLLSYFEIMEDELFNTYIARGANSRQDFIISREARDGDPLGCEGETFTNSGNIDNWVILN